MSTWPSCWSKSALLSPRRRKRVTRHQIIQFKLRHCDTRPPVLRHHAARFRPRFLRHSANATSIDAKTCAFSRLIVLTIRASKYCPVIAGKIAQISAFLPENARISFELSQAPSVEMLAQGTS